MAKPGFADGVDVKLYQRLGLKIFLRTAERMRRAGLAGGGHDGAGP